MTLVLLIISGAFCVFPISLHGLGWGNGFRMIQKHSIYWVLYFYYYYISSTSNHKAFQIPEVGDPSSI
jgi:hypothetical protein